MLNATIIFRIDKVHPVMVDFSVFVAKIGVNKYHRTTNKMISRKPKQSKVQEPTRHYKQIDYVDHANKGIYLQCGDTPNVDKWLEASEEYNPANFTIIISTLNTLRDIIDSHSFQVKGRPVKFFYDVDLIHKTFTFYALTDVSSVHCLCPKTINNLANTSHRNTAIWMLYTVMGMTAIDFNGLPMVTGMADIDEYLEDCEYEPIRRNFREE